MQDVLERRFFVFWEGRRDERVEKGASSAFCAFDSNVGDSEGSGKVSVDDLGEMEDGGFVFAPQLSFDTLFLPLLNFIEFFGFLVAW